LRRTHWPHYMRIPICGVMALVALVASVQAEPIAMEVRVHDQLELGNQPAFAVGGAGGALRVDSVEQRQTVMVIDARGSSSMGDDMPAITVQGDLHVNGTLDAGLLDADSSVTTPQWRLAAHDTFEDGVRGWSANVSSTCGGPHRILGGHCRLAGAPVDKVFANLPPHQSVRVEARFYFIDEWRGQVGWMMLDQTSVWAQQHAICSPEPSRPCPPPRSICGRPDVADTVGVLIDVVHRHSRSELTVTFGTQGLQGTDPCEVAYGVQAVAVYVR